jgi:hypothetical protein
MAHLPESELAVFQPLELEMGMFDAPDVVDRVLWGMIDEHTRMNFRTEATRATSLDRSDQVVIDGRLMQFTLWAAVCDEEKDGVFLPTGVLLVEQEVDDEATIDMARADFERELQEGNSLNDTVLLSMLKSTSAKVFCVADNYSFTKDNRMCHERGAKFLPRVEFGTPIESNGVALPDFGLAKDLRKPQGKYALTPFEPTSVAPDQIKIFHTACRLFRLPKVQTLIEEEFLRGAEQ